MGKESKDIIRILIIIVIYALILRITGIGCPIRFLTGISCMGCGMSRAVISLMRFQFKEAFNYHPLVYILPLLIVLIVCEDKIFMVDKNLTKKIWRIIIISFFAVYLIRLVIIDNSVVQINIKDGFIYKIIKLILERGRSIW
ncbi:MAG: DUF2752 domain-containing protein [Lachnospiraceae bacterium]|nr:DUF2752 domain-containing protein [Lachnospiraceae bacterium]